MTRTMCHLGMIVAFLTIIPVAVPSATYAHEGHQPLPSQGVLVDTRRGHVTLSAQARYTIGLQSREVVVGPVASTLNVYAEALAPWQSKAFGSAQIPGRITKLLVRPGDFVEKDQVVAELSSRELEAIKLDYLTAASDLAINQRMLTMTQPSAQAGAIPMQRLFDIENAVEQSQNRLEVARIRASTLGIPIDQFSSEKLSDLLYQVRSPISGQILHSDLAEGMFVEAFEHLFEIVNSDQVWVRLQILEKDITKIQVGNRVRVEFSYSKAEVEGTIEQIDAGLDPQTQVCWAWMSTSHPAIVPGLVGNATIFTSEQTERLAIPQRALHSDGLQSYVFVEEASTRTSGEYRKKNVRVGERFLIADQQSGPSEPMIELLQGDIYPGDQVVVRGGHQLSSLFFLGVLKLTEADQQRLGIQFAPALIRDLTSTLQLPALVTLPPENRGVLSSQLNGTVYSHTLSPGRIVQAGETLIEIASPDFYQLQLDLISTSLDADLSRRRAERLEKVQGDAIAIRIVLETRMQAEQLEIQAQSLRRQLATLGLRETEIDSIVRERKILNHLPIRSNIAGRVASSTVTLGETVAANQPLVEVHNLDRVWIEAHVPARDIGRLAPNTRGIAFLLSTPQVSFPAVLSRISPVVNESTRTQRIWLTPKQTDALSGNIPQLRAGTLTSVDLRLGETTTALTVPVSAVLRDGLHHFLFVQKEDGYIERRRVAVGVSDGELTEILHGIAVDELVVTTGGRELQTAFASLR
ncbi:efflux RND transporter periplasmic adaptor subunit [Pirellulaceae bacterium SH449]